MGCTIFSEDQRVISLLSSKHPQKKSKEALKMNSGHEVLRSSSMKTILERSRHSAPLPSLVPLHRDNTVPKSHLLEYVKELESQLMHSMPTEIPMSEIDAFCFGQLQHQLIAPVEKDILQYGINVKKIFRNSPTPILYEQALKHEPESFISSNGALCCSSGAKTGRSPGDKRMVKEITSDADIWWGKVNMPIHEQQYFTNRERAIDFLNIQEQLYIVDAYAGWDPEYRINVRVITTRAYHALFMQNMLVLPTEEELKFFTPDFLIYNAGCFPANRYTEGVTSQTHVSLHLGRMEMVILGTQYAGEMKKGLLTLMMYLMPKCGQLPLHSSCNVGKSGDVTLFFGLSGTGKTTLSADPSRQLIGDDEHVWTSKGVFNIEGGCYAKCKDLTRKLEPELYDAIRFGAVLENVILDSKSREVDYTDLSITENTRCAFPLKHIQNAIIPAMTTTHASNIVLLTCDAFGVIPPVSLLSPDNLIYHFISGYTSKMAGTEQGILEPTATFSACFGAPFLVLHPLVYAEMLAEKIKATNATPWLVNTGWICGSNGSTNGRRIPLEYSRAIINAIHDGSLIKENFREMKIFGLKVPEHVNCVPSNILFPEESWGDSKLYTDNLNNLAKLFIENFHQYEDKAAEFAIKGGPHLQI